MVMVHHRFKVFIEIFLIIGLRQNFFFSFFLNIRRIDISRGSEPARV